MRPIEPAELSALLDGELNGDRASEVEAALADDSALQAEFDALSRTDSAWRAAAGGSVFAPNVQLPRNTAHAGSWFETVAVIVVLVAVRLIPKLRDALEFGFILHGLALAIVLAWVTRIARGTGIAETAPGS